MQVAKYGGIKKQIVKPEKPKTLLCRRSHYHLQLHPLFSSHSLQQCMRLTTVFDLVNKRTYRSLYLCILARLFLLSGVVF